MNTSDFIDYCRSFYDMDYPNAIYPFATTAEVVEAVYAHMTDPNPSIPFDGDSIDREAVRDRVLAKRRITGIGETDFDIAVRLTELRLCTHPVTSMEYLP